MSKLYQVLGAWATDVDDPSYRLYDERRSLPIRDSGEMPALEREHRQHVGANGVPRSTRSGACFLGLNNQPAGFGKACN